MLAIEPLKGAICAPVALCLLAIETLKGAICALVALCLLAIETLKGAICTLVALCMLVIEPLNLHVQYKFAKLNQVLVPKLFELVRIYCMNEPVCRRFGLTVFE